MVSTVKFFIYAHGNVIRGEEGASYDSDPLRKIRLKTGASYKDLLNAICSGANIDPNAHQIKVHHRHPRTVEGKVRYALVPILDDDDVEDLIETAEKMGEGSIQDLYIEISGTSIAFSEQEMRQAENIMPLSPIAPLAKRDRAVQDEDIMPKRARYEDPPTDMGENLVVTDFDDPVASPISPSQMSMNITKGMEEDNQTSRASSSTTPPLAQDYEVFLSFSGIDTRHGFTDHLYNRLVDVGVLVFRDDNELRVGKEIGPELLKAIKTSTISIPIISKNYASSSWCLRELVQILECTKTSSQVMLPIFYQVGPSEVRNQTGGFGEGFLRCKNEHYGEESLIQEWKNALGEVTSSKGWESSKIANGHEAELVRVIVHEVLQVLRKGTLPISDDLVGVEDHVQTIIKRITNAQESNDVQAIVIHGMGGIGKTTLAKLLYNRLYNNFECWSFLANIRATSQQHRGIEDLQEQLVRNVSRKKESIANKVEGATVIKARCHRKKVLILLDDIDHKDQLDALVGKPDWFGRGTIIIITSRGRDLLRNWKNSFPYELDKLNQNQSFLLFCKHAFKRSDSIPDDYKSIAEEIVSTTDGLPLAIEVIGCLLYRREKSFWEGNLKILKEIPHDDVKIKLKISFEALNDEDKDIFLDMACLQIYDKVVRELAYMWESFVFSAQVRIENLISLSLIKREENGELTMHDQLRDLGRDIVRHESIYDPGQRSRIWKEDDALEVLELKKGTQEIQALHRWWREDIEPVRCTSKQFEIMRKLRYLLMGKVYLEGDFENLFQNLIWLRWSDGGLDFMRSNFIPKKLVFLELSRVNIVEEWMGWSQIKHLRILKISFCRELKSLPNISALKELEVLSLEACDNLRNIHPSIGDLCNLESLNLSANPIRSLPTSIQMLSKLQKLELVNCAKLKSLPDLPNSLTSMEFRWCLSINTLPDFSYLTKLEDLKFTRKIRTQNTTLNFRNLNRIKTLRLRGGNVYADFSDPKWCPDEEYEEYTDEEHSDEEYSDEVYSDEDYESEESENLQSESGKIDFLLELPSTLVNLILKDCYTLQTLPNFSDLKNLYVLSIENCPELMKIDGLDGAESLTSVMISKCKKLSELDGMGISVTDLGLQDLDSLVRLPNLSTAMKLKNLRIHNCRNLIEIQGLDDAEGIESVVIDGCSSLERIGDLSNLKMLTTLEWT